MRKESRVVPAVTKHSLGITSADEFNRLTSEAFVGTKTSFKFKSSPCDWQLQNQVIRKWSGEPSHPRSGQTGKIAKANIYALSLLVWLGKQGAHKTGPCGQETGHMVF